MRIGAHWCAIGAPNLPKTTKWRTKIQQDTKSTTLKSRINITIFKNTIKYSRQSIAFAIRRSGVRIPQAPPLKYRMIMRYFCIYAFLETHKKLSLVRQLVRQILPFNASDYFLNYLHIADRISEEKEISFPSF